MCSPQNSGKKKKKININILGGTVSGTNRNRPWDKRDPSSRQIGTCPWDKPAFFLFNSVKSPFCPVCPWDGWGFVPGTIVPQGPSEKCFCFFLFIGFFFGPPNTGNFNFSLWLTGGLSQGCPDFQKVYVFKVYVPFSCPMEADSHQINLRLLQLQRVFMNVPA